jgi:hypothetical protein
MRVITPEFVWGSPAAGDSHGTEQAQDAHDVTTERSEYELVVRGRIGSRVLGALEGLEVTTATAEETHLRGWMTDQAALRGVLERIRDLGLELTDVHRVA